MATLNAGTGADGNATVSANKNISTETLVGRSYADMISYSCSAVDSGSCTTTTAPNGIVAGDEVLLINLQGTSSNYANVGNYETLIVDDVTSNTITFSTSKIKNYGDDGGDTNIGTSASNQRVMVQRVPQYADLTIDNGYTLTTNAWDGTKGGVLFFRVSGTFTSNGSVNVKGKGYRGGAGNTSGSPRNAYQGESYLGLGAISQAANGTGGGSSRDQASCWQTGAGGGGYGTAGTDGTDAAGACSYNGGTGGGTVGDAPLTKMYFGGGSGGPTRTTDPGPPGGGIIAIHATTADINGAINADGNDGTDSYVTGGGAGGSISIYAGTVYFTGSSVSSVGGVGGDNSYNIGGAGGDGRIAVYYATLGDSVASLDPAPYTDSGLELPYNITGTISTNGTVRVYDASWNFVKSEAVTAGSYQVSNLPNAGPFFVIAESSDGSKNAEIYKGVVPTQ
jgi:hypothetical protein